LIETGDKILSIHMLFDPFWGISFDEFDDPEDCLSNGQKNLLGYALMQARAQIIEEENSPFKEDFG
jgi:predicted NAD-dependent protein-ADP-ribosyltransferase YbiA (DUF1768 family)